MSGAYHRGGRPRSIADRAVGKPDAAGSSGADEPRGRRRRGEDGARFPHRLCSAGADPPILFQRDPYTLDELPRRFHHYSGLSRQLNEIGFSAMVRHWRLPVHDRRHPPDAVTRLSLRAAPCGSTDTAPGKA